MLSARRPSSLTQPQTLPRGGSNTAPLATRDTRQKEGGRRNKGGGLLLIGSLCLSLLAMTSEAVAAVTLVADDRSTFESSFDGTSISQILQTPDAPFADFDTRLEPGLGVARQISSVSPSLMTASGFGQSRPGAMSSAGRSRFSIDFSIDTDTSIDLSGRLENLLPDPFEFPLATAEVFLVDLDLIQPVFSAATEGDFDFSSVLTAGNYRISAFAEGAFSQDQVSTGSFELALVFIPEPSTALLLGWGLAAMSASRRSARRTN